MRLANRVITAHLEPEPDSSWLKLTTLWQSLVVTRNKKAISELPDIAQAIGLLLASGLPIGVALDWLRRRMTGDLASELEVVSENVELGADLSHELELAADRLSDIGFSELTEKLRLGISRGAPVADQVMQLAASLRNEQGRLLLKQAGSSETKMLIPTIFVILPVTVLFAVFPSVLVLQQSF